MDRFAIALHNGIASAASLEMSLFHHEMRFLVDSPLLGSWPETGFAEVSAGAAFDGTALCPKPTVKWKMGCFEITNTRRGL